MGVRLGAVTDLMFEAKARVQTSMDDGRARLHWPVTGLSHAMAYLWPSEIMLAESTCGLHS